MTELDQTHALLNNAIKAEQDVIKSRKKLELHQQKAEKAMPNMEDDKKVARSGQRYLYGFH